MSYGLSTYHRDDVKSPALSFEDSFYDLGEVCALDGSTGAAIDMSSVDAIVQNWDASTTLIGKAVVNLTSAISTGAISPLDLSRNGLCAPYRPSRIFGAASNYREHAAEMDTKLEEKAESSPYVFVKASTSVIGPEETVLLPPESDSVDWEVELGVVIGKGGRRIRVEGAEEHIAGYTVLNDVSARDMNRRTDYPFKHDWFRGKSWDTFCPLGPRIVPKQFISDPHNVDLRLTLNGDVMQDGNTSELIFNIFEQIAYVSSLVSLEPGDLFATGTPDGVGAGRGIFLKAGDVMVASAGDIGDLRNPVADEQVG